VITFDLVASQIFAARSLIDLGWCLHNRPFLWHILLPLVVSVVGSPLGSVE